MKIIPKKVQCRFCKEWKPSTLPARYAYDSSDNLSGVTDAANNNTVYTYDDAGNLKSVASPDAGNISYNHDNAGNVKTRTDANNIITTYQYDALNRLTAIQFLSIRCVEPPDGHSISRCFTKSFFRV